MHRTSYRHMASLIERYLTGKAGKPLTVIDVGSSQVDETGLSYRKLFNRPDWNYTGLDVAPGLNVDVVLSSPYIYPFQNDHADVIVSGQAFEHIEFFWLSWLEMVRILKPGGYIFLIAPSRGVEHRYPADCWRFYPDGFRALAHYGKVEILEAHTDGLIGEDVVPKGPFLKKVLNVILYLMRLDLNILWNFWGDTVGVFRKPL